MNKKHSLFHVVVLTCWIASLSAVPYFREPRQTLFMGTIQWPKNLKKVPTLRIYHAGHQLSGEINNETRQMTYAVPELRDIPLMTLIITEPQYIKTTMAEDNTINHLVIAKDSPYKCYQIERMHIETNDPTKMTPSEGWRVDQRRLRDDGIIPDNALIICCKPDFIDEVAGGNAIDLPTIRISADVIKKVGSESALHETADIMLLSCLNLDTLHTKLTFDIKQHQEKKLVAFNIM